MRLRGALDRKSRSYPISIGHSFESLLLIAGSGRSGTTWLQELLAAQARFRIMFEPFHVEFGPESVRSIPPYIPPSLASPSYLADVEAVLRGKVRDAWTDHRNHHLVTRRRMIKEIHSNLRLGWLRERFPYFPIVFLLRHPFAVAASRERIGWELSLESSFSDRQLVEDHLAPFRSILDTLESDFDRGVMQWCIENYVPLRYFQRRSDVLVVSYERLVVDLDRELSRLAAAIGIRVRSRWRADTPSKTTFRPAEFPIAGALDDWCGRLSDADVERGMKIVSAFGLDALYSAEPMPRDVDPLNLDIAARPG